MPPMTKASSAMPPMTPPTIAPIGVELLEDVATRLANPIWSGFPELGFAIWKMLEMY